jgi:hypothetical protein
MIYENEFLKLIQKNDRIIDKVVNIMNIIGYHALPIVFIIGSLLIAFAIGDSTYRAFMI